MRGRPIAVADPDAVAAAYRRGESVADLAAARGVSAFAVYALLEREIPSAEYARLKKQNWADARRGVIGGARAARHKVAERVPASALPPAPPPRGPPPTVPRVRVGRGQHEGLPAGWRPAEERWVAAKGAVTA